MKVLLYGKKGLIKCISKIESVKTFIRYGSNFHAYQIVDETCSNNMVSPNAHTQDLIQLKKTDGAVGALQCSIKQSPTAFIPILKAYAKLANWEQVNNVYTDLIQNGVECDAFVCSALISIYAKLGSLEDAYQVFNMACSQDVVLWNAMIAGYTDHGHGGTSLCLLTQMQQIGVMPSKATIVAVLKSCTNLGALEEAKRIHVLILWNGLGANTHVASSLIDMYGKCSSVVSAELIFEHTCERDTVVWNVMITVQIDQSLFKAAHTLFEQMKQEGMLPNSQTVLGMLKGCAKGVALKEGIYMHAQLIRSVFELDLHVINALIDMYVKCSRLKDAREIFDNLHEKSVVSWNAMLIGYVQQGLGMEALSLYRRMRQACVNHDSITLTTIIKACTSLADLEIGKHVHILIVKDTVFESHVSVCNALIEMYATCKSIEDALAISHSTCQNSIVIWNALITAYSEQGLHDQALSLFKRLQQGGIGLDTFTYVNVLKSCTMTARLEKGRAIYAQIVKGGLDRDHLIITSLVDMFAKCGSLEDGNYLFESASQKDVALWTSMISGYSEHSMWEEAASLFKKMEQKGVHPDRITFVITLKICAGLLNLEWGKHIHAEVLRRGLHSDVSVANTIMDMYIKCKNIDKACEVFKDMTARNIVSWNVMIAGFVQEGNFSEALQLFKAVRQVDGEPDGITFINAIRACSMQGALEQGKQLHTQIKSSGYEMDVVICNTLMDMYIKCGSLGDVCTMFNNICEKNIVSWNVMIAGYAQHGLGKQVRTTLEQMQATNIVPDGATFSSVLSSCNHEGLKSEGYHWFSWFILYHGVLPVMEVYASLVDLLCRAGCLWEAQVLIKEMPMHPNAILWMTVLGACRFHGNVAFGTFALAAVREIVAYSDAACFLPSNIYTAFEGGSYAV